MSSPDFRFFSSRLGVAALVCFACGTVQAEQQAPAPPPAMPGQAASAPLASPESEVLRGLLAKPMSTGAIAALVAHSADPAAQARLSEALGDRRGPVRAVAARVAYVTASRGLVARMRTALATEEDPEAANELLRAVVTYGGNDAVADAWTAVDRLNAYSLPGLGEALARSGRPDFVAQLPRLVRSGVGDPALMETMLELTAADPAQRSAALTAIEALDTHALPDALSVLRTRKEAPPKELLIGWLRSEKALTRETALWHVLEEQSRTAAGTDALGSLGISLDEWRASTETKTTIEALGVELLARAAGRPRKARDWTTLQGGVEGLSAATSVSDLSDLLARYASGKELDDLSEGFYRKRDYVRDTNRISKPPSLTPPARSTRMVGPFAPGLWQDLASMYGCKPSAREGFAAAVKYKAEGRPWQVSILRNDSPACSLVAGTLFSLTLFRDYRPAPPDFVETLILPLNHEAMACSGEASRWLRAGPARVGRGGVKPPTKVRHVDPVYSGPSRAGRELGLTIMEGTITAKGCMRDVRLIRSSSSLWQDMAWMLAASRWQFTPTLVDGRAVPVVMMVTVNLR